MKKLLTLGVVAAILAATTPSRAKDVDFVDIAAHLHLYQVFCTTLGEKAYEMSQLDEEHLKSLKEDIGEEIVKKRAGKIMMNTKFIRTINFENHKHRMRFCDFIGKGYINVYDP